MGWLRKLLGGGNTDDVAPTIKLRLARWRHFLATEQALRGVVEDVRDKLVGEYIFDRQYAVARAERAFQEALRLAYDAEILCGRPAIDYARVDQLRHQVVDYAMHESPGRIGSTAPAETVAVPRAGDEPEYQILAGLLARLAGDGRLPPPAMTATASEASGTLMGTMAGVSNAVRACMTDPVRLSLWPRRQLALAPGSGRGIALHFIDLDADAAADGDRNAAQRLLEAPDIASAPWAGFWQGLASTIDREPAAAPAAATGTLALAVTGRNLLLVGAVPGTRLLLSAALTGAVELNHCYAVVADESGAPMAAAQTTATSEVRCFGRSGAEIEERLRSVGRDWGPRMTWCMQGAQA